MPYGPNDGVTTPRRVQFTHGKFKMPIRGPGGVVKYTFLGQEKEKNLVKVTKEMCCNSQLLIYGLSLACSFARAGAIVASHVQYPKQPLSHWHTAMIGPLDSRKSVFQVGEHDTLKNPAEEFQTSTLIGEGVTCL